MVPLAGWGSGWSIVQSFAVIAATHQSPVTTAQSKKHNQLDLSNKNSLTSSATNEWS